MRNIGWLRPEKHIVIKGEDPGNRTSTLEVILPVTGHQDEEQQGSNALLIPSARN